MCSGVRSSSCTWCWRGGVGCCCEGEGGGVGSGWRGWVRADGLCRDVGVRKELGARGIRCKGRVLTIPEAERKGISYGNFGSCMFSEMDEI